MEHNAIFSFLFIPLPGITTILHDTLNVKIHYLFIPQYVSIWPLLWRLDNIKISIQHTNWPIPKGSNEYELFNLTVKIRYSVVSYDY